MTIAPINITIPSFTFQIIPEEIPRPTPIPSFLRPDGRSIFYRPVLNSTYIRP